MSGGDSAVPRVHGALAARLTADLTAVRRLWPSWVRFSLWAMLGAALLALVVGTSCRSDLAEQLRVPAFVLHLGMLFGAAGYTGALAFRAAVPGDEPGRFALSIACALTAGALLFGFMAPAAPAVTQTEFLTRGLVCAAWTAVFALPPWAAAIAALYRGAAVATTSAAACAGAAATLLAAGILRTACPIEDRWHIFIWHLAPVALAAVLSMLLTRAWLRRWKMCTVLDAGSS